MKQTVLEPQKRKIESGILEMPVTTNFVPDIMKFRDFGFVIQRSWEYSNILECKVPKGWRISISEDSYRFENCVTGTIYDSESEEKGRFFFNKNMIQGKFYSWIYVF